MPTVSRRRHIWKIVLVIGVCALVVIAIPFLPLGAMTTVLTPRPPGAPVAAAVAKPAPPKGPLPIFTNGKAVDPFVGYLGSDVGTQFNYAQITADGAQQPPNITATPDPSENGLRVVWTGAAAAQFYLQTANPNNSTDLSSYADNGGALVFDMVLHVRPTGDTTRIRMDCHNPCEGSLSATQLFANLPVGQQVPVEIPLSCFASAGLDPTKVNTPLVVYSERQMDATFSNVRVQAHAANAPGHTPCSELPSVPGS
jgi:hypothetical protein